MIYFIDFGYFLIFSYEGKIDLFIFIPTDDSALISYFALNKYLISTFFIFSRVIFNQERRFAGDCIFHLIGSVNGSFANLRKGFW